MKYVYLTFVVIAGMCYASSVFYIFTTSDQEVKNFCRQDIMDNESKYSQRNVACKFRKHRK